MKRKLLTLLPFMTLPFLNGCGSSLGATSLTYGTYKDDEAVQLSNAEFTTHIENKENFLMAIYPKDSSCSCWSNFSRVINDVVTNKHLLIYKYYAQEVEDNALMKKMGGFNNRLDAPTFYIIQNKQIAKYYNYSNSTSFFKDSVAFYNEISQHIKLPHIYYLDEEGLDEKILEDRSVIYFARNKCSDCNYVTPNTLMPYFDALEGEKRNLYLFDLQSYRDENMEIYQTIKDKYLLSTVFNETYGFGEGVVPTFQVYEKGELKDMCVYVNDGELTYSESEGCYYATSGYYVESRLNHFHYLDNVEVKDLSKVKIPASHTIAYENSHYWDITYSSQYYDPILKGFLNTYL
ncbi:MAG: hypothetical protein K5906_02105 [Bacilli bacterium]|nr:hypothetical protein [Bacilli bacterium]